MPSAFFTLLLVVCLTEELHSKGRLYDLGSRVSVQDLKLGCLTQGLSFKTGVVSKV